MPLRGTQSSVPLKTDLCAQGEYYNNSRMMQSVGESVTRPASADLSRTGILPVRLGSPYRPGTGKMPVLLTTGTRHRGVLVGTRACSGHRSGVPAVAKHDRPARRRFLGIQKSKPASMAHQVTSPAASIDFPITPKQDPRPKNIA